MSYPEKEITIKKDEEGKGYIITDGTLFYHISNPHDVDFVLLSEVFKCHPRSVWLAQIGCAEYKSELEVKNDFFEDDVFQPKLLAERIMQLETFITSIHSKEIYVWKDGYYQPLGDTVIEKLCKHFLQDEFRKNRLSEVIAYIRASTYTKFNEPANNLINLENGILDIETEDLKPHDPEYHFFNKIPVEYDPNAEAPLIHKFLREITNSEEDAKILEEMIGYCLLRDYPIHKALMLVGEGANGKTTFLKLITRFLGRENISSRSLHDLEYNRFAKASLFGKLANLYDDLPDKALKHTGTFKMVTGLSPLEAEKKFRDPFKFVNYAKLIFSANKVPEARDDTDAFFRRWIIITFPNKFEGENCDPHILEKLSTKEELSGLLILALEGLKRILENGAFSYSQTTDQIRKDYIRKSDPLGAFALDCLEQDTQAWISKQDLYNLFTAYCRKMKLPPISRDTFYKNLPQHATVSDFRPEVEGKRVHAFLGVKLTEYALELMKTSNVSMVSSLFLTLIEDSQQSSYNKIEKTLDRVDTLDTFIDFVDKCPYCGRRVREDDRKVEIFQGGKRMVAHFNCHVNGGNVNDQCK